MVCTALLTPSSKVDRSPARAWRPAAVKKFTGLSIAELTFLPVERRCCTEFIISAVFCSDSRFARTPAERVILLAIDNPS
jgi:hypothetical protein